MGVFPTQPTINPSRSWRNPHSGASSTQFISSQSRGLSRSKVIERLGLFHPGGLVFHERRPTTWELHWLQMHHVHECRLPREHSRCESSGRSNMSEAIYGGLSWPTLFYTSLIKSLTFPWSDCRWIHKGPLPQWPLFFTCHIAAPCLRVESSEPLLPTQ